jgi:hypothetical protein
MPRKRSILGKEVPPSINEVIEAFHGRPVMERLNYMKEILCNRAHATEPPDAALLMVMAMVHDIADELEQYPEFMDPPGSTSIRKPAKPAPG